MKLSVKKNLIQSNKYENSTLQNPLDSKRQFSLFFFFFFFLVALEFELRALCLLYRHCTTHHRASKKAVPRKKLIAMHACIIKMGGISNK
jgi:hypothetical protein